MAREGEEDEREQLDNGDQDDTGPGGEPEGQDPGDGDDDPEDPSELLGPDDGEPEGIDEPAPPRGRAAERIRRQQEALAEERERTRRLEADVAALRARVETPQQETAEQEAARLALMSPEERSDYRLNKSERNNQRMMQSLQMQLMDTSDKTAFETRATFDPVYRRHAAEVEKRLGELRAQGQNIPRDKLLTYIVGEKAMAARAKGKGEKDRQRGQDRIERERTPTNTGRGDVAARRGKTQPSLKERLKGVQI